MTPVEEIKSRIDIVDFLRGYLTLNPAGKNFKANCPFHKEKTPSFMVSPERQTWHCFGACGEGGDIFKFLMKHDNIEFHEALKILAEKAGVELRRLSPADQRQFGVLYDINESAKDFFKKNLEAAPEIMEYVSSRGLKKETLEEFEIGFALPNIDKLMLHLVGLKFDVGDIERSGLAYKSDKSGYFDRFRGRLMFPIHNYYGKAIGFSGRIMPQFDTGNLGKYVNSPETPIFNKSRILYGIHKTKSSIREKNEAVLVEGQMDFLMSYQDGLKNVAATSGTALTPDHLRSLRRLTDKLILCFDNDEAGQNAIERGIDLAGSEDFTIKVLEIKEEKDPADVVKNTPGLLMKLAEAAVPAMEFYFERFLSDFLASEDARRADAAGLKQGIRRALQKLSALQSPVERAIWIKRLSEKIGVPEKALIEESEKMRAPQTNKNAPNPIEEKVKALKRIELISERLLSLAIYDKKFLEKIGEAVGYFPEPAKKVYRIMNGEEEAKDEGLMNIINLISLRSSFEISVLGEENIEAECDELIRQLKIEYLKSERTRLRLALDDAKKKGDDEAQTSLFKKFDETSKLLENT